MATDKPGSGQATKLARPGYFLVPRYWNLETLSRSTVEGLPTEKFLFGVAVEHFIRHRDTQTMPVFRGELGR